MTDDESASQDESTDESDSIEEDITDEGLTDSRRIRDVRTNAAATAGIGLLFAGTLAAGLAGHLNETLLTMVVTTLLIAVGAGLHWLYGGEAVEAGQDVASDTAGNEGTDGSES